MRLLVRLAILLVLPLLAVVGLWFLATETRPLVERDADLSPTALVDAKRLLTRHDPRPLRAGALRQISLPLDLADQAFNHLVSRRLGGRAALAANGSRVQVSLSLPAPGSTARYLNLRATVDNTDDGPQLAELNLGRLPVPAALADYAIGAALRARGLERQWQLARQSVRRVSFNPRQQAIVVDYIWQPALLEQARAAALDDGDLIHLRTAQTALAAALADKPAGARVALAPVLESLLNADADIRYRRAALLVLAVYAAERNLAALMPEAGNWPRPRRVALTLRQRYDAAQHFAISAALAAWAGAPIADALGRQKELDDAQRGSGFSFADLAADRAGARFGQLVMEGSERLRTLLQATMTDTDLMPPLDGLPEYMPQREFERRFGGTDAPAYRRQEEEIERRLAALALYR